MNVTKVRAIFENLKHRSFGKVWFLDYDVAKVSKFVKGLTTRDFGSVVLIRRGGTPEEHDSGEYKKTFGTVAVFFDTKIAREVVHLHNEALVAGEVVRPPAVPEGSVWRDMDPRNGQHHRFLVVSTTTGIHAHCVVLDHQRRETGRSVKIRLDRFAPSLRGYEQVFPWQVCPDCKGTGTLPLECSPDGAFLKCGPCVGTGKIVWLNREHIRIALATGDYEEPDFDWRKST